MKAQRVAGPSTDETQWLAWPGVTAAPAVSALSLVPEGARAIFLAPHPDDEILMAGGLLQRLHALRRDCLIIAATDGESSHPNSRQWPATRLRVARPLESALALSALQLGPLPVSRLGLPDGGLNAHAAELRRALNEVIVPGDVLFTTCRFDGHPDHDCCGLAAADVTAALGATLVEVPVWAWHWAVPDDSRVPWQRMRRLPLTPSEQARKRKAVNAFVSQLHPDPSTGREAVLLPSAQARLARQDEFFFLRGPL